MITGLFQSCIPFLTRTIRKLLRYRWVTQAEIDTENDALATISRATSVISDALNLTGPETVIFTKGGLPVQEDMEALLSGIGSSLEDLSKEKVGAAAFAKKRELSVLTRLGGAINAAQQTKAYLEAAGEHNATHRLIVLQDSFADSSLSDTGNSKDVEMHDGFLGLRNLGSDVYTEYLDSVSVETNGEPGNPHEVRPPSSFLNKPRTSNQPIDLIIATSMLSSSISEVPGNIVLEEKSAKLWSESDAITGDVDGLFERGIAFEIGCMDLRDYSVPVRVITPFCNFRDNIWSPVNYGEAIELSEDDVDVVKMNIFEFTGSKNAVGKWPRHGYGWSYASNATTDIINDDLAQSWNQIKGTNIAGSALWIGAPGNYLANSIYDPAKQKVSDIVSPTGLPYSLKGDLKATITVKLKNAMQVDAIDIDFGEISRPGISYGLPIVEMVEVLTEDGKWVNISLLYIEQSGLLEEPLIPYAQGNIGMAIDSPDSIAEAGEQVSYVKDYNEFNDPGQHRKWNGEGAPSNTTTNEPVNQPGGRIPFWWQEHSIQKKRFPS